MRMKALEERVAKGLPIEQRGQHRQASSSAASTPKPRSVSASSGDPAAAKPLLGKVAIANARAAYAKFEERIGSDRWKALAAKGAQVQRPLWARH